MRNQLPLVFVFVGVSCAIGQQLAADLFSGSEPDEGVGGIAWGTNVKELSDMEFVQEGKQYPDTAEFRVKGQVLQFSDLRLKDIRYCFWKGLLYRVSIETEGLQNWTKLKLTLGRRYPELLLPAEVEVIPGLVVKAEVKNRHHMVFAGTEIDDWTGQHVNVFAQYDANSQSGNLTIASLKMYEKIPSIQPPK